MRSEVSGIAHLVSRIPSRSTCCVRYTAIAVPAASWYRLRKSFRDYRQYWQVFTRQKANTRAQHIIRTISAESFLILVESNWIQTRLRVKRAKGGRRRRSFGSLTQVRKNRIILLNGACDNEPEVLRRTASDDDQGHRRGRE